MNMISNYRNLYAIAAVVLLSSINIDAQNVRMIKDILPGPSDSHSEPIFFAEYDNHAFFIADIRLGNHIANDEWELWRSDGTEAGTELLEINVGSASSFGTIIPVIPWFTVFNGKLYFQANDGINGSELWKINSWTGVPEMVSNINPGAGSSTPAYLTVFDGALYFTADDGINGNELWKMDATEALEMVKDIFPGSSGSNAHDLLVVGNTLFFGAFDTFDDNELWKTDGTTSGTVQVKDIHSGISPSANIRELTDFNGTLFFTANQFNLKAELWKSDGTEAGTVVVKNITSNIYGSGSTPRHLTVIGDVLFFNARDDDGFGRELWRTDGTEAGTYRVKDIRPGIGDSGPAFLTAYNSELIFTANDGIHGNELWKSDGTEAGTVLIEDINEGSQGSTPFGLTIVNGDIYFSALTVLNGREFWKYDGAASMVVDIIPGPVSSNAGHFFEGAGTFFFAATDGIHGYELWGPCDETPTWYADNDGDGDGDASVFIENCIQPLGYVSTNTDCDDTNSQVYLGAPEICDGIDNNCDGVIPDDEIDNDGDTFSECNGDCDDTDNTLFPGAIEICDGIDNDCDGVIDELADNDNDGYIANDCDGNIIDCNDNNPFIHPGAVETCDGIDNDCNGLIDDEDPNVTGLPIWYSDSDGDGYGTSSLTINACLQPSGFVSNATDCDDTNENIHPFSADVCDGIDNDCDGTIDNLIDNSTNVPITIPTQISTVTSTLDIGYSGIIADLNIVNLDISHTWINDLVIKLKSPAGTEITLLNHICGSQDNLKLKLDDESPNNYNTIPCPPTNNGTYKPYQSLSAFNGEDPIGTWIMTIQDTYNGDGGRLNGWSLAINEGTPCCPDMDGDGHNDIVCGGTDCFDTDPNSYPGAPEICDGLDNDCDGEVDEGNVCCVDADEDGYEDIACGGTDCDDADPNNFPGNPEVCDGADNNCDGVVDEGFDQDYDGIADCFDNCINTENPNQEDDDGDGIGDNCDPCPTVPDPACDNCGNGKVLVCHRPAGNPDNEQQLCISINAANAHIGNHGGCYWGYCNGNQDITAPPLTGYEVKETDKNNNVNSRDAADAGEASIFFLELYPNPANEQLNIHLHGHSANTILIIHDQFGRSIWQQTIEEDTSECTINLKDTRFANGMYVLNVSSIGGRVSKPFVILK